MAEKAELDPGESEQTEPKGSEPFTMDSMKSKDALHKNNGPRSAPPIESDKRPSQPSPLMLSQRSRQATIAPPSLESLEERYASLSPDDDVFSSEEAIEKQITSLEEWTRLNVKRERLDLARFWVLRCMAFGGATVAGVSGYIPSLSPLLSVGSGCLAVVALAIDSAWPPSSDRVTRRRAIRELRELQQTLKLRWDKVRLAHPEKYSPKRIAHALAILDMAQSKREDIGKYLSDSSPSVKNSSSY